MIRNTRFNSRTLLVCFLSFAIVNRVDALPPAVTIVVVPGLTADDLIRPELSALTRIATMGAYGWMVCRAALPSENRGIDPLRLSEASEILTLHSGARATCPATALPLALVASGPSGSRLATQTVQQIVRANSQLDHAVKFGAIGWLAHRRHQDTAAIADAFTTAERVESALLCFDQDGRIDLAGPRLARVRPDAMAPQGMCADVRAMVGDFDALPESVAVATITFHDLDRADRYTAMCLPAAATRHRQAALTRLNELLTEVLARCLYRRLGAPTLLIVAAPGPATTASSRDRLAPVVLWGSRTGAGPIISGSTRREGLVVDTDLLPTLVQELDVAPFPGAIGRPMGAVAPGNDPAGPAVAMHASHAHLLTTAILQDRYGGLPTLQACLALATAALLWRRRCRPCLSGLAAAMVALPLGMLILPPIAPHYPLGAGILLIGCVTLASALASLSTSRRWAAATTPIYALCAALALSGLVDLFTGLHLLRDAWMGYSVMEGARYYGIGNEYMGALIGACCVLLTAVPDDWLAHGEREWVVYGLLGLLLLAMTLPALGAKVGAIPSAGCAFGVAIYVWRNGSVRPRDLALVIAVVGLLLGAMLLVDLRHSGDDQSHLARAFSGAAGGPLSAAKRKLLLEGRLLLRSPWSAALIAATIGLVSLWNRVRSTDRLRRSERAAFSGLAAGAIVSLVCNDSGVSAAAMIVLIGLAWAATSPSAERNTLPHTVVDAAQLQDPA
jgi:hypothetical protein